ncbi:MAG: peptidase [Leadbetterella sp.]
MTFCLGVKTAHGLVAFSDRRITSGSEVSSAKKVSIHTIEGNSLFIMTAGLRSVRDKAITYFQEVLDGDTSDIDKLYKAVNALGEQVKRVVSEDFESLSSTGLKFNLSAIVGGKLKNDKEPKLFLLYPEGNWIEVTEGSPFIIIGNSGHGKPILYRNIRFDTPTEEVLKLGFLAFDSTRVSANDVDFPIDVLVLDKESKEFRTHTFQKHDLEQISMQWNALLNASVQKLPNDWIAPLMDKK